MIPRAENWLSICQHSLTRKGTRTNRPTTGPETGAQQNIAKGILIQKRRACWGVRGLGEHDDVLYDVEWALCRVLWYASGYGNPEISSRMARTVVVFCGT